MRAALLGLAVALAACHPIKPPPQPGPPDGMVACPSDVAHRPVAEDGCAGRYLVDTAPDGTHPACSRCPAGSSSCFVAAYSVYCVADRDCADPKCTIDTGAP